MKRLLSIILSLSLVLSFSFTAFAAEPSLGTEKTVESEGYTFSPSISISLSTGEVSASIGLAITEAKDTRSAETEIHYVP